VLAPDLALSKRIAASPQPHEWWELAPTCRQILSHNDTVYRVEEKVDDWLANGCSMVVTVNDNGVLSLCIARTVATNLKRE